MGRTLEGVVVPLLTPFDPAGDLDEPALRGLIDRLIRAGVHGVIANAATGEFFHLTDDERKRVGEITVEHADGRVPVLVGAGAPGTRLAIDWARHAADIGADGLLVMPPYYVPLPGDAVIAHVASISDAVDLPIMFYSNPSASHVFLTVKEIAGLAARANIPWIKLSTGRIEQVPLLIHELGDRVRIFEGWDPLAFPSMALGAVGWISAPANAIPETVLDLWRLTRVERNLSAAAALNHRLAPLLDFVAQAPIFCSSLKEISRMRGYPLGAVRQPYQELTRDMRVALADLVDGLGLDTAGTVQAGA